MGAGRIENLRFPRSTEEAREWGAKGGVASGKARRMKRSLRDGLVEMLSARVPKDSPLYPKLKAQLEAMGLKGSPYVSDLTLVGLINQAAKGRPDAFAVLRDTIGEKPKDVVENVVNAPPVVLGLFDPARAEAEKEKQNAAVERMREEADNLAFKPPEPNVADPARDVGEDTKAEPAVKPEAISPTPPPNPKPTAIKPAFFAPGR